MKPRPSLSRAHTPPEVWHSSRLGPDSIHGEDESTFTEDERILKSFAHPRHPAQPRRWQPRPLLAAAALLVVAGATASLLMKDRLSTFINAVRFPSSAPPQPSAAAPRSKPILPVLPAQTSPASAQAASEAAKTKGLAVLLEDDAAAPPHSMPAPGSTRAQDDDTHDLDQLTRIQRPTATPPPASSPRDKGKPGEKSSGSKPSTVRLASDHPGKPASSRPGSGQTARPHAAPLGPKAGKSIPASHQTAKTRGTSSASDRKAASSAAPPPAGGATRAQQPPTGKADIDLIGSMIQGISHGNSGEASARAVSHRLSAASQIRDRTSNR